jgi:DNA-binding SARP family transcriptional activator
MQFRVLGPLEVVRADGPVRLGRGKRRSLLALLLIHANGWYRTIC